MLQAVGLTKRFGSHTALDHLDLEVGAGEIYCLLGANGAGKTTAVNCFLDFVEPTEGTAFIDGVDVRARPLESKQAVAYIPEQVALYGMLTGLENLRYFAALATGDSFSHNALLALLKDVGLDTAFADVRVSAYSKGMRQKVWIAVALAKRAKAFLLDEPTSGLDPQAASEFASLLRQAADRGCAVLTTTHDLFHARHTATRIGIMKRGRLIESLRAVDLADVDLQALYLDHMRA